MTKYSGLFGSEGKNESKRKMRNSERKRRTNADRGRDRIYELSKAASERDGKCLNP